MPNPPGIVGSFAAALRRARARSLSLPA